MPAPTSGELPIIQATIDLIRWLVPLLNGLPRAHKFALEVRYSRQKLSILESLAARLDLLFVEEAVGQQRRQMG